MRKFTLFFMSLFLAVGAMAVDDPAVMDVNTSTVYTIQFNNGGSFVYCDNGEIYYEGTHNAANAENANYQFKFIEAATDAQGRKLYYIASVGADGFYAYNENTTNAGGAAGSVGLTDDATTKTDKGVWYVFSDVNFQYIVPAWKDGDSYTRGGCCWNKWSSSGNNLGMWGRGTSDPNYAGDNQLLIVDINAEVEQEVVVSALADFNPNKYYTVSTPSRGGWSVNNNGDNFRSTNDNGYGINVDKTKTQNQFAVLSVDGVNYYLFSVHANKFVKADRTLVAGPADAITFTDASSQGAGRVLVSFKDLNDKHINLGGENQMVINGWGDGNNEIDEGNAVKFVEAGDFDPAAALAMLTPVATTTKAFNWDPNTAWELVDDYTSTVLNDDILTGGNATVKCIETELTIENPVEATVTFTYTDGNCALNVRGVEVINAWGYIVAGDYHAGKTGTTSTNNVYTVKVAEAGTYKVRCYATFDDANRANDTYGTITIECSGTEATDFSHSMSIAAGYATLYLGYKVAIPTGVEAYVVSELTSTHAIMTQVENVIPANTGVILKLAEGAAATATYTFAYTDDAADEIENNLLDGSIANRYVAVDACVLSNGDNGIGLYGAILNKLDDTAFLNNANKAYLELPENAEGVASYSFRFDGIGTTAIENVEVENEVKVIYDLTGRRVETITAPGIYVVNGKKVLVK